MKIEENKSNEAVIATRNLWKVFYDQRRNTSVVAVQDISFSVKKGEFVCLVGPSGCGKTTLIRILAALEKPTYGEFDISGMSGGTLPAMVFQENALYPWFTVEENVAFPLRIQGIKKTERKSRIDPLLEMTGLTDFRNAYPYQLSGGMKQRTSVACALARDSDILLMDEPFGALDEQTRLLLQQELLELWEKTRKTIVFITHSVDEALTLGDRVIVMESHPGRIKKTIEVPLGRPRNVLELRRDSVYGDLVYQVWRLLEKDPKSNDSRSI